MAAFPTPPPLKPKSTGSLLPAEARQQLVRPDIAAQIVLFSGIILMAVALLVVAVLYFIFRSLLAYLHVPFYVPIIVAVLFAWAGFYAGSNMARRLVSDALRSTVRSASSVPPKEPHM
jgi:hypothetical protein